MVAGLFLPDNDATLMPPRGGFRLRRSDDPLCRASGLQVEVTFPEQVWDKLRGNGSRKMVSPDDLISSSQHTNRGFRAGL